jgi:hypothetical protein
LGSTPLLWGNRSSPCPQPGNAMAKQRQESSPPKRFGVFYPRGYVVVALRTEQDAERMRWSLIEGGYDEEDVMLLDSEKVLELATAELEQLNPLVRAVGDEFQATESHIAGARAGQQFLVAYAPSELDTERLMNVARRIGYLQAQKYDRFSVTVL